MFYTDSLTTTKISICSTVKVFLLGTLSTDAKEINHSTGADENKHVLFTIKNCVTNSDYGSYKKFPNFAFGVDAACSIL